MMCEIYENASRVLVWLGREDESTPAAIHLVRRLAKRMMDAYKNAVNELVDEGKFALGMRFPIDAQVAKLYHTSYPTLSDAETKVLSVFFNRRWFSRIWCIQEIALSGRVDVRWGPHYMSWDAVTHAIHYYWAMQKSSNSVWKTRTGMPEQNEPLRRVFNLINVIHVVCDERGRTSLELPETAFTRQMFECLNFSTATLFAFTINATRSHRSTDLRDKVFDLLGIVEGGARVRNQKKCPIKADYGKSVLQVYEEVTLYIMNTSHLMSLSMVSDRSRVQIQDLPSWAVDFSAQNGFVLSPSKLLRKYLQQFEACKGGPRLADCATMRRKVLCLCVCVLDYVVGVGEAPSEVIESSLEPYISFTLRCPQKYVNGQSRVEVLWRTLIRNTGYSHQRRNRYPASNECGASFRSWLACKICIGVRIAVCGGLKRSDYLRKMRNLVKLAMSDGTGLIPRLFEIRRVCDDHGVLEDQVVMDPDSPFQLSIQPDSVINNPPPTAFELSIEDSLDSNARIYRTPSGYVEAGPFSIRPGDVITIIAGKKEPLVVRPFGPRNQRNYQLLGDTHVHGIMHGIMHGEAWQSANVTWEEIQLV